MAIKILALLVIAVGTLVLVITYPRSAAQGVAKDEFHFDAAQLKDKALWTRINDEPYYLTKNLDISCVLPTAADYARQKKNNPHASTFITVYVNKTGKDAMYTSQSPRFPEGSIIVKQKLDSKERKPLLYTIMRKREPGYNPQVGDWEFSVVGANGTEMMGRGKIENCQSCHVGEGTSDFVFRDYVNFSTLNPR